MGYVKNYHSSHTRTYDGLIPLSSAGHDDSGAHQHYSQNFRRGHPFVKQKRAQDQDKNKSKTHKRVSVAQFKLSQRNQPAHKSKKTSSDSAKDPRIQD